MVTDGVKSPKIDLEPLTRKTLKMTENTEITMKDEERQPCEIWTRVMGYFRPMSEFNIGKKSEFAERRYFKESLAVEKCACLDRAAE